MIVHFFSEKMHVFLKGTNKREQRVYNPCCKKGMISTNYTNKANIWSEDMVKYCTHFCALRQVIMIPSKEKLLY